MNYDNMTLSGIPQEEIKDRRPSILVLSQLPNLGDCHPRDPRMEVRDFKIEWTNKEGINGRVTYERVTHGCRDDKVAFEFWVPKDVQRGHKADVEIDEFI